MTIESMSLLNVFGPRDGSYSGKDSYRHVERILRGERNLLIVSPYIDLHYARYLVRHSRGKRIRIISSSMQPGAYRKLKGRDLGPAITFTVMAVAFDMMLLLLRMQFLAFALVTAALAAMFFALSLRGRNNIYVKVPREFVHAKMYIGDNAAAEGSANLTYAGMHRNVEHIDLIYDRKRIADLKRQFQALWDSA
jgi:phosphatidylserine/phosphatidylglycerophosphate/cardiolipin synthase-like enzyme